jgi:hypothetical protein
MAGQLTLKVLQRFEAAGHSASITTIQILSIWHLLAREWETRAATPQSALMVLHPGMMRLIERLTLQQQPPPAAAGDLDRMAQQALLAAMSMFTNCCGVVVDPGLHPAVKPWYERARSSSSSRGSRSSMVETPTTELTAVVLGAEVRHLEGSRRMAICML